MNNRFSQLLAQAREFRDERDWQQFHSPRHMASALAIEVAELQELMLWLSDEQVQQKLSSDKKQAFAEELADVFLYCLYAADAMDVDILKAAANKLEKNQRRYPKDKCQGRADKYDEL